MTAKAEWWLARNTLACRLYARPYEQVIRREITLGNMRRSDRILNVGCGPAPFTAMLLAEEGFSVTALDCDERAVGLAREAIRSAGYVDRVNVMIGNPATDVVPSFDVALVALQVRPKDAVVAGLLHSAGAGARILVRESATWCEGMYDHLTGGDDVTEEVYHHRGALERTLVIRECIDGRTAS